MSKQQKIIHINIHWTHYISFLIGRKHTMNFRY